MDAKKMENFSFADYVKLEQETGQKYEFHDGRLCSMAGESIEEDLTKSIAHGLITTNVIVALGKALDESQQDCRAVNSEIKLNIAAFSKYVYPDAMVVCGEIEKPDNNVEAITNPTVIVEVLSKSTEAYDRGDKFFFYKHIESLEDYILIDQYEAQVDLYTRGKGDLWRITRVTGMDASLHIPSVDVTIRLSDLYRSVVFE